jgi:peroxiredoxin
MRALKLTGQVVALAAVAGLLGLLIWRVTHRTTAPAIGGPAPVFSLSRVDVPCKGEATMLEQAWQQYRKQGVVFVGVDYHDVTSDARRFLEHHDVTYPSVQDGSGSIADRYGVSAVPETYFIDRRGRLVGTHIVGTVVNQAEAFRRGVEAALAP